MGRTHKRKPFFFLSARTDLCLQTGRGKQTGAACPASDGLLSSRLGQHMTSVSSQRSAWSVPYKGGGPFSSSGLRPEGWARLTLPREAQVASLLGRGEEAGARWMSYSEPRAQLHGAWGATEWPGMKVIKLMIWSCVVPTSVTQRRKQSQPASSAVGRVRVQLAPIRH